MAHARTDAHVAICFLPRAPRWRARIARLAQQFAGMTSTGRGDLTTRPCAWCPPTPPPEPVTRPCALCERETHRSVQSPPGVEVNGEPACTQHAREVAQLRGLMADRDAWDARLRDEQAVAEGQDTAIMRAYHRRRALRFLEAAQAGVPV